MKNSIIAIIINSIICPFTVVLNVLVIMAVKRIPRLQSKTNVLLACLAITDALTGLVVQPWFILFTTLQLLGVPLHHLFQDVNVSLLRAVSVCSCLHLMLVTCERFLAIKFTMQYPYIVTDRNIKAAVISFWIFSIICEPAKLVSNTVKFALNISLAFVLFSCVLFILFSYVTLYRETLRHRKMMKTRQLPPEEVERFAKDRKALKTTVILVSAVIICYLPISFFVFRFNMKKLTAESAADSTPCILCPWLRTFVMLNSLLNPIIYCCRQKEMRQFVFRLRPQAVAPHPGLITQATNSRMTADNTQCKVEIL